MNKIVCSLYLKSKHILISIKQCNQLHLMDDVWYQGERCFLNNGTRYDIDGNHLWSILKKDLNENGTRDGWDVKDSEIKKMFTLFNIKNSLFYHYNWWKRSWYSIDLRKMMERNTNDTGSNGGHRVDILIYDDAWTNNFTIDKITSMKVYDMNGNVVMNLMEDKNEI